MWHADYVARARGTTVVADVRLHGREPARPRRVSGGRSAGRGETRGGGSAKRSVPPARATPPAGCAQFTLWPSGAAPSAAPPHPSPGMCFRSAADPDGTRVRKSGASSFASTNLFFSVPQGKELEVDAIRKTLGRLKGFLADPLKFRVSDCKTALMCFFESESLAADAMSYMQNNPKALPPMTEVIYGKQAKAPSQ